MNMEDLNEGTEIPQQEDESDMDNEGDEDELDKDLPRILGASTNSSTNTEWSGSVTPLQSAGAYWNAPFDSNNGSQQEEKDQFTRRVTTGIFTNIGPELVGRLNVVPITGFDSVSGCPVLCAVSGNVVFGKWIS
uniref:Predicted protein n=1 Tax=Physcomitrium patens TaxID=3218 RepID=A9U613_PHYPA